MDSIGIDATLRIPNKRHTLVPPTRVEAQLVVLVGRETGRRFRLGPKTVIGRDADTDFQVDDDGVSRAHVWIERGSDGVHTVHDMGSRNGTFVNGVPIREAILSLGDKIALGVGTVLLFTRCDPLEDQLVQARKMQMLGELAGGIAHDFNNLLAALLSSAGFLRSAVKTEDPAVAECIDDIDHAAARARELASQLMAFARNSKHEHAPASVTELLEDATRLARRVVPHVVEIDLEIEPNIVVRGDRAQLLQSVMNLCVNAADAMPDGGCITIRAGMAGADDPALARSPDVGRRDCVVVSVLDEGVGMSPETVQRVFEPFFTTKPRGKGTGLGLATSHRIAREHGGFMTATSQLGQGSEFRLYLPATVGSPREAARPPTGQMPMSLRGLVLLVEDEDVVRKSAKRLLEHAGLEVITAGDGVEAIEVFRDCANRVDVVVLDLDLPRMSGDDVFEVLREMKPDIEVLISSGFVEHERQTRLEASGVTGFLHKPYSSSDLLSRLAGLLQRSQVA